ncbi:hypothetical protein GCM10025876_17980 [Demequina litorisediminis]|uniref:Uncharacterized protein n=1 Tax=Demequina litorisediminis TaxID=1849022 RepID=A0ABQ6IFU1_9MICO|nr:hypothetical protein GCM10025876_17980 [Demequina litorisediminis]
MLDQIALDPEVRAALDAAPSVIVPGTREELYTLSLGPEGGPTFSVDYDVDGDVITEATVTRCRNGMAVNYPEDYMRRRDPQCMVIADDRPTDKTRFADRFGRRLRLHAGGHPRVARAAGPGGGALQGGWPHVWLAVARHRPGQRGILRDRSR